MDRFRVEVIAKTPNPQQVIYAAMHQDYSENFVYDEKEKWPAEEKCGEIIVKRLLAGNRGHFGCIEHPQITFNCGFFPHSVMQQARTHRVGITFDVQCLASDSVITFVDINGSSSKKLKKTIGELYDLWHNGEKEIRERKIKGRNNEPAGLYRRDCKKRLKKMRVRCLNEENNIFTSNHIEDVVFSGLNPVYKVTLADGKELKCTQNHKILTPYGWRILAQLGVGYKVLVNGKPLQDADKTYQNKEWLELQFSQGLTPKEVACLVGCSTEAVKKWAYHHKLTWEKKQLLEVSKHPELAFDEDNLKILCSSCHSRHHKLNQKNPLCAHPVEIVAIEYIGIEPTYDLVMADPHHNFVANGVVVHNSSRYTGKRIIEAVLGQKDIEEVFYLRPVGHYSDRQGNKYYYSPEHRQRDLEWCLEAAKRYQADIEAGMSEEHARGTLPFDYRQHFVVSFNMRSFLHFCDLRNKKDAQLEIQKLCELMWPHFKEWTPAIAQWYEENRLGKARLAP